MEKYSRQALAEGVKNVADLIVTIDCELYRVLVLHYNRNNQIEVSTHSPYSVLTMCPFVRLLASEVERSQMVGSAIFNRFQGT